MAALNLWPVASGSGVVILSQPTWEFGALSSTEAADSAAAVCSTGQAAIAAAEAADTDVIVGIVYDAALLGAPPFAITLQAATTSNVVLISQGTGRPLPEAADAAAISGGIYAYATLAPIEGVDAAAVVAEIIGNGVLISTEPGDAAAISGGIMAFGDLESSEAPDIAAVGGSAAWYAVFAAIETDDAAGAAGSVFLAALLSSAETGDAALAIGLVVLDAVFSAMEAADPSISHGTVAWRGSIAGAEANDQALAIGGIVGHATIAARESVDTAWLTATGVNHAVIGDIEGVDAAEITARIVGHGTLVAAEANDIAAIAGGEAWDARIAAAETPDAAAASGRVTLDVRFAAHESADLFWAISRYSGVGEMIEAGDRAAILGFGIQTVQYAVPPISGSSLFEDLDDILAQAVSDEFAASVTWHPMLATTSQYTSGGGAPDINRPIVAGLQAVVTWKPLTESAGVTDSMLGGNRGGLSSFDVSIDLPMDAFEVPGHPGNFSLPVIGDVFELTEEYENNKYVQVKKPADDGSKRAIFYCAMADQFVSESA